MGSSQLAQNIGVVDSYFGDIPCCLAKGGTVTRLAQNFQEWDIKVSHFAEWGLYACIFIMTISGLLIEFVGGHYVKFFGLFYIDNVSPYLHAGDVSYAKELVAARSANRSLLWHNIFVVVHIVGAYGVLVFLTAHLGHIYRHQVILKDRLLNRMLPGSRQDLPEEGDSSSD